ncbi:TetR family transcriptional regulator [Nocardia asteroides]|uniref:TetR/AcrR family transcriptional regulator n=1 Tax=Nocardia asteroides TaxID=1824 RepID=UPI00344817C5
MTEVLNFHAKIRLLLRARVLDTARYLVCTEGWRSTTISRVAKEVGVSRAVIYKEFGTRQRLRAELIAREMDLLLAGVVDRLRANPSDVVNGMAQAVEFTLTVGANNELIKAVLAERTEDDGSHLTILRADPEPLLARIIRAVDEAAIEHYSLEELGGDLKNTSVEVLVRMTLSHLCRPRGAVEEAVEQISQVFSTLLGLHRVPD